MKRYKSLFREKLEIVDISSLSWTQSVRLNYYEAEKQSPSGYRLPTLSELYTAWKKKKAWVPGNYWSSEFVDSNKAFYLSMTGSRSEEYVGEKDQEFYVRWVKNI